MSDHEFERQVQEKMEELKFSPSADVWKGVELELDKGHKRRRAIFWWPAALLVLLAGAGYLFYDEKSSNGSGNQQSISSTASTSSIVNPNSGNSSSSTTASPDNINNGQESSTIQQPSIATNSTPGVSQLPGSLSKKNELRTNSGLRKNNDRSSFSTIVAKRTPRNPAANVAYDQSGSEITATIASNTKPGSETETAIADRNRFAIVYPAVMPGVGPSIRDLVASGFSTPVATPDTEQATSSSDHKKHKWSYGVAAEAGMSGINDGGMFNFNRASVVDLSGGIANSAFLPANTVIYRSSVIKPGPGFSIGGYAGRPLTRKVDLSLGLSFTRFNSSLMVGQKINSPIAVNGATVGVVTARPYYTRDAETKYSMHMDFVEIPVSVAYKLNPSLRVPVSVNAGITGGRLVGSNALHFDGSSAGYFKNNDLLQKWQLGVNAGVALTIMNKSKHPVNVGPSFRYQVSNSLSSDVNAKRNILGVGMRVTARLK